MAKKVKIGDDEYTISPIPPYIHPYVDFYTKLAKKIGEIENIEQAEQIATQLETAITRILGATTEPKPKKEHEGRLLVYVLRHNNEVNAEFFRSIRSGPSPSEESGRAGASSTQETKSLTENQGHE